MANEPSHRREARTLQQEPQETAEPAPDATVGVLSGEHAFGHLSASAISLPYQPRAREIRAKISRNAGVTMIAIAAAVLVGWFGGFVTLTHIKPQWAAMSFNTAICFLLLGMAFVIPGGAKDAPQHRLAGRLAAGLAGVLALLNLADVSFGLGWNINELFFSYRGIGPDVLPTKMSAATSTGLVLAVAAALLISWRTTGGTRPSLALAMMVGTIGLLGIIGHIYDAGSFYSVWFFDGLSLHTAVMMSAAAIGILGVHPDKGPLGVLAADGRGSRLARSLLPFGIVIPAFIGWARLQGERAGYYESEFGLALFATATVMVFLALIWLTATSLNREDILRRRADEAAEHEAIRRRILFEKAKDGILVLGADQRVVETNQSFADMIGYPRSAVTRLHPWDWIVDSKTRERVVSDWITLGNDDATFEAQLRCRDGSIIDAEVSCTTARFDSQQFLFFVCRDITQRKQSQQALHASEQRFRRALANIPDVVVIYDTDLRIQYINNASRTITGMSPDRFIGKRDEELLPADVAETYLPTLRKAFLTKQISAIETSLTLPGFGPRSLRITCVPLMDQDGEVREVLGITRDFTERREAEQVIRSSESKFRQLIEEAAAGIAISDAGGKIELVNSRCCELLGKQEQEILGRSRGEVFTTDNNNVSFYELDTLQPGAHHSFECKLNTAAGVAFPAEISVKALESGGQQLMLQDITSRYELEQKTARLNRIQAMSGTINATIVRLRNREELLAEACRVAVEEGGLCIGWVGLVDHDQAELQMVAQSGFGNKADEWLGQPVKLVPEGPSESAIFRQEPVCDNDISRSASATPMREYAASIGARSVIALPLLVEGQTFGTLCLYANETGFFGDDEIKLLRDLAKDISFGLEFIAKDEKLGFLESYDTITGLPNRSLFFHRLSRQLRESEDSNLTTILSIIDLDRFRMVNDTYGRHAGDAVIAEVAERLKDASDEQDTIARIGSNSFAIAATGAFDSADTGHRLDEINHAVFGAAFRIGDDDVRISATSGVAVYPGDGTTPEELLANAEAALRNARSRSARYRLYSPDMNERVAESMRLENKVRRALENGELSMWYQPKVCARSGVMTGLEALMRWRDSETGELVPPDVFIPVMEHTGTILDAGRWALQQVARDCLRWQEQGACAPRVAVNVSPIQLQQQDVVGSLVEAQIVAREAGSAIDVEITESVIMDDVDAIIPKLRTLHSVGTRVYVDDFGTGYSSLAYIAKLPIDALKIDRSFVSDLREGSEGLAIVRSIISLAKSLKLQVIAEGVENQEQADLLNSLECDELQGYHLGKPLPPEDTLDVIMALSEGKSAQKRA